MNADNHKAFFVHESTDGGFVYGYSYRHFSRKDAYESAERKCNNEFNKVNFHAKCNVYAIDNLIVSSLTSEDINKILNNKFSKLDILKKIQTHSELPNIQIKGTWEGVGSVLDGTISRVHDGTDTINLSFLESYCMGAIKTNNGELSTADLASGQWDISCANTTSAKLSFTATKPFHGKATGTDKFGNKLEFTFKPVD